MARVLFLGGFGRSGTTLVERLLGELPGICALGEVVHLWQRDVRDDERCGCGVRFSRCDFWQAIGDGAFGGWHRVDIDRILTLRHAVERTRHIPRLAATRLNEPFRSMVAEYAAFYAAIYEAAALTAAVEVVVDSSKHSALAHCLRWSPALDLRVVHVVRDPRGVAYSWTKNVARPETDGAEEMTRYSAGRSALLWNAHNAAFGLLARRGVPVHRLRYEQFLAQPRAELHALASHAGLDLLDGDLDFLSSADRSSDTAPPAGAGSPADTGPSAGAGPPGCAGLPGGAGLPASVGLSAGAGVGIQAQLHRGHSAAGNPMRFTVGQLPLRRDDAWLHAFPRRHQHLVGAVCAPMLRAYGYPLRRASLLRAANTPPPVSAVDTGAAVAATLGSEVSR